MGNLPGTDVIKPNYDHVAVLQPELRLSPHTYARRASHRLSVVANATARRVLDLRSGEDEVARHQSHALAEKGDRLSHVEDHVCSVAVL